MSDHTRSSAVVVDTSQSPFARLRPVPLLPGPYTRVHRTWRRGDIVRLNLPMRVRRVECHPYVAENAGRVALTRGPLLYCVEGADNPDLEPRDVVLRGQVQVTPPEAAWKERLYRTACPGGAKSESRSVEMMAIPYYAWANREPGPMRVWLRTW